MEEAEPRESQRNGTIFQIVPNLKSPRLWTPKLSEPINCIYYLSQFELGFLLFIPESVLICFWLSPFGKDECRFGDMRYIATILSGSIFFSVNMGRIYVGVGQPTELKCWPSI